MDDSASRKPQSEGVTGAAHDFSVSSHAQGLYKQNLVSRREMDELLRGDARYRFQRTIESHDAPENNAHHAAATTTTTTYPQGERGAEDVRSSESRGWWDVSWFGGSETGSTAHASAPPPRSTGDHRNTTHVHANPSAQYRSHSTISHSTRYGGQGSSGMSGVSGGGGGGTVDEARLRNASRAAARKRVKDNMRKQARQVEREAQLAVDRKAWEKVLEAGWGTVRDSAKVHNMCRRGVPPAMRRQVWTAMIGNPLMITKDLYDITVARAQDMYRRQLKRKEATIKASQLKQRQASSASTSSSLSPSMLGTAGPNLGADTDDPETSVEPPNEGHDTAPPRNLTAAPPLNVPPPSERVRSDSDMSFRSSYERGTDDGLLRLVWGKENSMELVDEDLPRTLPQYGALNNKDALRNVLITFVCYRPDIGYVQGMSYLAFSLLLYMGEGYECFKCFANLLSQHFCFDFIRLKRDKIDAHIKTYEYFFSKRLPILYKHFREQDIASDMYYLEWSLTLFVKFLPLDAATRFWDSYLLLGEAYCIRTALGILRLFAQDLRLMQMEDILPFLQNLPPDMDVDELFEAIDEISISPKHCEQVAKRINEDPNNPDPGAECMVS